MLPVWLAILFVAFAAAFMIHQSSEKQQVYSYAQSSRDAAAISAYKTAVLKYINAHPAASGSIDNVALAPHWPTGFKNPDPPLNFNNYIAPAPDTLYIFSSFPANNEVLDHLYKMSGGSVFVGKKTPGGQFESYIGGVTLAVPVGAVIPDNAIVIVGK